MTRLLDKMLNARFIVSMGAIGLVILAAAVLNSMDLTKENPYPTILGFSVAWTGLFSALLWAHAAVNEEDKLSNAAAAGFTGAVSAFGIGAIPPTEQMLKFSPWLQYLPQIGCLLGSLILLFVVLEVWAGVVSWFKEKRPLPVTVQPLRPRPKGQRPKHRGKTR